MKFMQVVFVAAAFLSQSAWSGAEPEIVFLGDNARVGLLKQCAAKCKSVGGSVGTPEIGSQASGVASFSKQAKHAVIVVDATQGPLPITREHIQIARQAGVPSLSIMFVNMAGLEGMSDAGELVELEEMEVRELMNAYEMKGDMAKVFHDASIRSIPKLHTNGVGLSNALNTIATVPPRNSHPVKYVTARKISSYLYLLSPQESPKSVALNRGSKVTVWVNGQVVSGVVTSAQALSPGDNGELSLEFGSAVTAAEGSRFLIERDGRIVAMGVVVRVGG